MLGLHRPRTCSYDDGTTNAATDATNAATATATATNAIFWIGTPTHGDGGVDSYM